MNTMILRVAVQVLFVPCVAGFGVQLAVPPVPALAVTA